MKKVLVFLVLASVLAVSAMATSFYDDFGNGNYTTEGWTFGLTLPCYPDEKDGVITAQICGYGTGGIVQNFSDTTGIDFSTNLHLAWNSSTLPNDNLAYTILKLTDGEIDSAQTAAITFYGDVDWSDSGDEDDLVIGCEDGCTCTPNYPVNYSIGETLLHELSVTVNSNTGEVTLTNGDGLFLSSIVTDCDISKLNNVLLAVRNGDTSNITDFLIEDNYPLPAANTAPVVVVTAPPNDTISGVQQNITFVMTDDGLGGNVDCTLFIDDVEEGYNGSVSNNTPTMFSPIWTTGGHQYHVECADTELTGDSGLYTFTYNSTHAVILLSPANGSSSTAQEEVSYEVYDSDNSTTSCGLYIDTFLNMTNSTVLNDTVSSFTPVWTGTHDWYIQCNDGLTIATSETRTFTFIPCTPNWQCSGYGSCNISDLAPCNAVTDMNTCGDSYGGDYSEFTAQACNYCSASVSILNQTACVNAMHNVCQQDANYASCCAVTLLPSDCPQNASVVCGDTACSTSPFSYTENDLSGAVVSTIAIMFIQFGIFVGIFVIAVLGVWAYKRFR